MDTFSTCLTFTLREEGGFVNNPRDPGGATNLGITRQQLAEWRDCNCSVADVRTLSLAEAEAIYGARYWNVVQGDALPAGLDLMVFDFGVNAGPSRAARMLQSAVGVVADGSIGPQSLAAAESCDAKAALQSMILLQERYYHACAGYPVFGSGWLARLARRHAAAVGMLA